MDQSTSDQTQQSSTTGSGSPAKRTWLNANFTTKVPVPAHPQTKFDEMYFIQLLALSISLSIDEKKKIVEAIPKLSQYQIDELVRIFEEEQDKFAELADKHPEQINKLRDQHKSEWDLLEVEHQAKQKAQGDAVQADEIRKKLGLV